MADPQPQAGPKPPEGISEAIRGTAEQIRRGIQDFDRAAEQREAQDPNAPYTVMLVEGAPAALSNPEKIEGAVLHQALTTILVKLKRADKNLNLRLVSSRELGVLAQRYKIDLTDTERGALDEMGRASVDWNKIQTQADQASHGVLERVWHQQNTATKVLLVAGLAAGALGLIMVGKYSAGKMWENTKKWFQEKWDGVFTPTGILATLGLGGLAVGAGAYLGVDKLQDYFLEKFGFTLPPEEARQAVADINRGKIPTRLQEVIQAAEAAGPRLSDQAQAAATAAAGAAAGAAAAKLEENLPALPEDAARVMDEGQNLADQTQAAVAEGKEGYDRFKTYQTFILEQNPELDVSPVLLAAAAQVPYAEFMKMNEPEWIERVFNAGVFAWRAWRGTEQWDKARLRLEIMKLGGSELFDFFSTMLEDPEDSDFEGKTVEQVLAMVKAHPQDHLDEDAVRVAHEKPEDSQRFRTMMERLDDPNVNAMELVKDQKFYHDFIFYLFKSGLSYAVTTTGKVVFFIYRNLIPVGECVSARVNSALIYIGERWASEGGAAATIGGNYLKMAGFLGGVTIPAFAMAEVAKTVRQSPFSLAFPIKMTWTAAKGGFKGLVATVRFPLDVVKALGSTGLHGLRGINPLDTLKAQYYHRMFQLDRIKEGFLMRQIAETPFGKSLGLKSFIARVMNGEIEVTENVMKRLHTYKKLFEPIAQRLTEEGGSLVHSALYQAEASHYKQLMKEIDELEEAFGWEVDKKNPLGRFNAAKWQAKLGKMRLSGRTADILQKSRRLYWIFSNEKHPLRVLAGAPGSPKFDALVELLSRDAKLLESLSKNPLLAHDHEVARVFADGAALDAKEFARMVAERAKVWKKFSARELAALAENPRAVAQFSRLKDILIREEGALKAAKQIGRTTETIEESLRPLRQLRRLMLKPDGVHARVLADFPEKFKILFENTSEAKRALERFVSIPHRVLEAMESQGKLVDLADNFGNFASREKAIADEVARLEQQGRWAERVKDRLSRLRGETKVPEGSAATVQKIGKLATALKWAGVAGGTAGAGWSLWEAGSSLHEAWTTDVQGRRGLELGKAGLYGVSAAADIGATAGLLGVKGAATKLAGRAALPLVPIVYAGTKIFDTLKEETLTEVEWAQRYSYEELVHQWFSTCGSVSLGDAWVTGFEVKNISESMAEKKKTTHKMYKVLLAAQKNPAILECIATEKPSRERDQKVETMMNAAYSKYHEYFFSHHPPTQINVNYERAQRYLAEAQLFDDLMELRGQKKAAGVTTLKLGPVELMDDLYSVERGTFSAVQLVACYKQNVLTFDAGQDPHLKGNLEGMETSYLLRLYLQAYRLMADPKAQAALQGNPEVKEFLERHMSMIRNYVVCGRGVNFNVAITSSDFTKPAMELEELTEHLESLHGEGAPKYREYASQLFAKEAPLFALHRLARHLGYSGDPTESGLKNFFAESKASYQGIYCDGSNWFVQESGMELDDKVGPTLTAATVQKMISLMRDHPEDILEHRHDTAFASAYDYSSQVQKMASLLEQGLHEGPSYLQKKRPHEPSKESVELVAVA